LSFEGIGRALVLLDVGVSGITVLCPESTLEELETGVEGIIESQFGKVSKGSVQYGTSLDIAVVIL